MFTAFDVVVGILVLISAILATARGLTREVLSLATWAGSAAIAVWMWQYHPDIARSYVKEAIVADVATVVVSFIVALIVLHLITMRIADFVVDSRIGPLDRTLGFVFGGLRGVLIAVVIVIFGQWLNWGGFGKFVEDSKSMPMLQSFGEGLIAALPNDIEDQINGLLNGEPGGTNPAVPADGGTDSGEIGLNTPA